MTAALCTVIAVASLADIGYAQGSPVPTHRYSFANPAGAAPDGSAVTDSVGGANGVVRGEGATFTGTRATIPGGSGGTAAYIDLPNGLLSVNSTNNGGSGQLTFEGWVKVTGARNWGRIFDFGSSLVGGVGGEVPGPGGGGEGRDYLMWSATIGTDVNNQRIEMRNEDPPGGGTVFTADHATTTFNTDFQFVVTWDEATGQLVAYENGVQVDTRSTTLPMSAIHDVNNWLGRSNWTADNNMQGEFDEFRIYDRVLSLEQVQASLAIGPDAGPVKIVTHPTNVVVSETRPASFSTLAVGTLPITYQWYQNDVLIPGATSTTYSNASVSISENNARIYAVASNNIEGTAYTATSQVAILTVLGDTNPPTVLQVRVNAASELEVIFSESIRAADAVPGNFTLTGPAGTPTITGAAVGGDASRVVLTLSGPLADCAFYAMAVSGVHDISPSGNLVAPGTSSTFWNFTPAAMTHRYNFNSPAAPDATGGTVPDLVGTGDGIVRNGGGVTAFTGSRVTLSGGVSTVAPYIDLPNRLLSVNSTNNGGTGKATFEGWTKVTGAQSWARILDFGTTTAGELFAPGPPPPSEGQKYFFYSASIGTDVNRRRVDVTVRDATIGGGSEFNTATFNQDVHFVITWDEASGVLVAYENGVEVGTFTTPSSFSQVDDVNVWLGRSNWVNDNNMQGEFDEFRVYNTILSAGDAKRNFAAGADNNFGALLALNFALTTNNLVTNTVDIARVLGRFSNAGTQDIATVGCVTYSSSDSNVVYISSDGVIHAIAAGTATVTASLNGLTDSELIGVTADVTPPFLVSARANSSRHVEVVFSEPVEEGTAQEGGNYTVHYILQGLNTTNEILSVEQLPNQSHVLITLSDLLPPCETITVRVSFVGDQSPLFNQIAENSPISFLNYIPTGLKQRYTFNNAASADATSAIVADGVGTADGTVVGAGGTFTGDRVTFPGGASGGTASVVLPSGLLSTNAALNGGSGEITFEGWMKVTGNRNWGRIFDFGSTVGTEGRDYFMLSASIGMDVNNRRTELRNEDPGGGGIATIDHATTGFNRNQHFAATWNEATGQIRVYEDGVLKSSIVVNDAMSDINDVNCYLGRSNWSLDENMQGEFDEFRIYDRVLNTNDLAQSIALGPDFNLGTPPACGGTSTLRLAIRRTGSTFTLSFTGTAGTSYRIQRATALTGSPISWTTVSTQTAPAGGAVIFEDTSPPSPQAFYRVVSP